jgi:hypothetical protein
MEKKEESFLMPFAVTGYPGKTEITFAFHSFSEEGKLYCKVLTINEKIPEFSLKFNNGAWQLQENSDLPEWFTISGMEQKINNFLLTRMN